MLAFSTFLYLKRLQQAFAQPIQPQQAGYIYVWACQPKLQRRLVSNETQGSKVWFDDVKVTHTYSRVTQASDYYAFGSVMREQKSPDDLVYRYGYQGEYSEKDLETGWNHFELREFDAVVGRWTAKDPYGQYYSPYVGMGNDPINGVDPDGGKANPIYDMDSNFLGTDSRGLKGEAIFMHKSFFSQGMAHETAMEVGFTFSQFSFFKMGDDILQRVTGHWLGLTQRPDWDGFITISEGIAWAKAHPGAKTNQNADNTLYADVSQLDFGNVSSEDLPLNMIKGVSTFNRGNAAEATINAKLRATVYALGRVNMRRIHGKTVEIINDDATIYDWNLGGEWYRDALIREERMRNGLNDSHGFHVFYYGNGLLRK